MPVEHVGEAAKLFELGGFATVLGLIIWLVRRVFTHTIPRLAKSYEESLDKQQDLFQNSIKEQQTLFQNSLEKQRDDFKEALREERTEFRVALHEEREFIGKRLDRLSDAVERLSQSNQRGGGNGV